MRNALFSILLFMCAAVSGQQVVMGYPMQTIYNPPTSEAEGREDIWYVFEYNTTDTSGNGYDWTNTGPLTFESSGAPEGSWFADDNGMSGDYITLPTGYTDAFPTDFTICFWYWTSASSTGLTLINCGTPWSSGFNARISTAGEDFDVFTDAVECNATNYCPDGQAINEWYHFVISYESSTGYVYVYIDGVEAQDNRPSPENGATDIDLTSTWYLLNNATGSIDDFRIFPEILSEANVLWIKNNPGVALPAD